jgi:hypothetical protein
MKYRIVYKDSYTDNKTIVLEANSYWEADSLGRKMFKEKFVSCEYLDLDIILGNESSD